MLITCCRIITYVLLCGYTPFRADDMKEVIQQTTEARVDFHNRYWKNVSDEGTPGNSRGLWECAYLTCTPSITAKNFIRALLHPNPTCRLTAEQALSHTWLTSFAAPTEHDLCGLRENFDPRAHWRNAIEAARAMSCLRKVTARTLTTKRVSWYSAPTMKTISQAEVGRRRHARHQNPTPRYNSNTSLLHRQMIAHYGAAG